MDAFVRILQPESYEKLNHEGHHGAVDYLEVTSHPKQEVTPETHTLVQGTPCLTLTRRHPHQRPVRSRVGTAHNSCPYAKVSSDSPRHLSTSEHLTPHLPQGLKRLFYKQPSESLITLMETSSAKVLGHSQNSQACKISNRSTQISMPLTEMDLN
ncbi:hypothetical protein HispidOSU_002547 [Sigmodon hispidus]